ncbi:MAG TPA: amidohydrolase family protein [Woeseiaceae bacterium]|nr:amidohydrolase family protein [Woeseiaceae bacterium]
MTRRLTQTARCLALLALSALASCDSATAFLPEHPAIDILIENGEVFDGLGGDPVQADVVIVGDSIVFVGDAAFSEEDLARRVATRIDAAGRVVTPGFIDLHSHGDPLETPEFENFLAMGVTTISLGQDGSSPDTVNLEGWLDRVSHKGIGPNLAMFVGHGTLRSLSGIGLAPEPAPEDLATMLSMLDKTLPYTFGMSTGLEYNPGLNARPAELRALAEVVGRHGRVLMSHMRNEDDDQLELSIAELLEQGEYARVHISHLKSVFGKGAARADEILGILDAARDSGVEITADVYPYTASYTWIGIVFPAWAKTAEQFEVARRERRDELARYLRERVEKRNGPEATLLGTGPYKGKTLADLSFEHEMPFEDVLIDVIGPEGASGAYFVMDEELQSRLLQRPYVGICSDGSPTGFHPRGHGTFAKIIEDYVVRQGALSLAEAVRKMTSFPAGILGIDDRGRLQPGSKADVLLFDPARVRARATYPEPLQLAEGFDVVIVNGEIARSDGRLGELSGRVLRPQASVR